MRLIGSRTSPFVRRIRLQLNGQEYELDTVDIFSETDRGRVSSLNPAGRMPVLVDGDRVLWDSRLITRYLREKRGEPPLSLETELELDLIDNAGDTGVLLFQLRKFRLDERWENPFSRLQAERLHRLLGHLESRPTPSWGSLTAIWLYCLLDWLAFREVVAFPGSYPRLGAFLGAHAGDPLIQATDPRK